MDIFFQDIRYAARKLARSPSFTIVAVLTLALAIGATTTVFSIVNGVLLKPLPFRAPHELIQIGSMGKDGKAGALSGPDFVDYRARTHSFTALAPFDDGTSANLTIDGEEPVRLNGATVGAQFFNILGVSMTLGRGFNTGDDVSGAPKVVVISNHLWRDRLSSDPQIIGRPITLNGTRFTVIGVAPPSLTFPFKPDVWTPFVIEPWMVDPENRGAHWFSAIGRLRAGVSVDAARNEMHAVGEQLRAAYPKTNTNFGGTAMSLQTAIVGDVGTALFIMFGAVAFVLLIACANVANLLLVRAAGRETEIAVRTALGAGRGRIVRQLITESVLLSLGGAAIGGALAGWATDAIVAFGPKGLPRLEDISVDVRVLAFTVLIAVLTGLVFGLVPAFHSAQRELGQVLKEATRGSSGRRSAQRTRSTLVVGEMALAVVLLVGAGLLIQSFVKLLRVDPGFRAEHVVSFNVSLPQKKYPIDRDLRRFASDVQNGLSSVPGVQSVAVAFARPMARAGARTGFDVEGRPSAAPGKRMITELHGATANFFETMGMRLVRGRLFTQAEESFGPPTVVVVNEALVKKYFPNENPIGLRITLGFTHDTTADTSSHVDAGGQIVGIVNDVHQRSLSQEPQPAVYAAWGTLGINDITFLVRSRMELSAVSAAVRERVHSVDATLPVFELQSMEDIVSESLSAPRFYTLLLTAFAAIALLLAAIGVYGVISYSVSQRTREMGIRIALGASQERVVRLVLGRGLWLALTGVVIGLVGSFWLMRVLSAQLFGVDPTDPVTFGGVAVVLLGVASLASYLPARQAAAVDPVIAMRTE